MSTARINVDGFIPEHVSVEHETTGQKGGDAGHGGWTELTFRFEGGCNEVEVLDADHHTVYDSERARQHAPLGAVVIRVRGDWEMGGLDLALKQLGIQLMQRDLNEIWTEE